MVFKKNLYFISVLLSSMLLLLSCGAGGKPKSHLWTELSKANTEPLGYAMYTYVLVRRSKGTPISRDKYNILINIIMNSTSPLNNQSTLGYNKSLYNLFLIPSNNNHLNDELSKSILTSISVSIQNEKLNNLFNNNPGPFLISTLEPISDEYFSKELDLLYVDLTKTNIDALPEIVSAYKKYLVSDSIKGVEQFSSLKLTLLNLILDADDSINIVKVAYAGWIKD